MTAYIIILLSVKMIFVFLLQLFIDGNHSDIFFPLNINSLEFFPSIVELSYTQVPIKSLLLTLSLSSFLPQAIRVTKITAKIAITCVAVRSVALTTLLFLLFITLLNKIKFVPTLFRLFGCRLYRCRFHYSKAIKKRGNIPYCSISEARPKAMLQSKRNAHVTAGISTFTFLVTLKNWSYFRN